MLINGFAQIDNKMNNIINEMINAFENTPKNLPDLAFHYYSVLTQSETIKNHKPDDLIQLTNKNPISQQGRISILKGCLQSIDLTQKIKSIHTPLFIVQSLRNCLINKEHTKAFLFDQEDEVNEIQRKKIGRKNEIYYYKGGHAILEVKILKLVN